MSDDKSKKGPPDSTRISLSERYEIEYWTQSLGVSETELRDAVKNAGNSADAVRKYLQSKKK